MILSDEEIRKILGVNAEFCPQIEYARDIESAMLDKLKAQEPYALEVSEDEGDSFELVYPSAVTKYNMFAPDQVTRLLYEHPLPPDDVVRDAARYRWLRNHGTGFCEFAIYVDEDGISQRGSRFNQIPEMLDAAVDAAMEKMK